MSFGFFSKDSNLKYLGLGLGGQYAVENDEVMDFLSPISDEKILPRRHREMTMAGGLRTTYQSKMMGVYDQHPGWYTPRRTATKRLKPINPRHWL